MKRKAGKDAAGARARLREFFLQNLGKVVDTATLGKVAGISEYARRIRELRDIEGFKILSYRDRSDLKPRQYLLIEPRPRPVIARGIDQKKRTRILARNGYTCQVCGGGGGEPHPFDSGRRVRLQIDHFVPKKDGGTDDDANLRVLCSVCNESRSNLEVPLAQQSINLIGLIRRAPRNVQLEILGLLKNKFEK